MVINNNNNNEVAFCEYDVARSQILRVPRLKNVFILQQRPHHPVRPIPSQLWCKNFGNKEY